MTASTAGLANPVQYTGREYDEETGLYCYRARYYDPAIGRFISEDPFRFMAGPNFYQYALNSPVNLGDPSGYGVLDWLLNRIKGPLPPPPSPPSPVRAPAVLIPGTPQYNLDQAQAAARVNPTFFPTAIRGTPDPKTYCNLATTDIAKNTGAPTDPLIGKNGEPNLVNDDFNTLANSPYYRQVTQHEAQALANQGVTVIAVQENPGHHGHIATVVPELMPGLGASLGLPPMINNIGGSIGVVGANRAFPNPNLPLIYYAPK